MKHRRKYGRLGLIAALIPLWLGCAASFDKDTLKGKVAEPLDAQKANQLKNLPDKPAIFMTPAEDDELVDIVYNYLHDQLDHKKFGRLYCHLTAIGQEESKCEAERKKCLQKVDQKSVRDIKAKIKEDKADIKKLVDSSLEPPKIYLAAFAELNFGMHAIAKLDCNSTEQEIAKIRDEAINEIASRQGQQEAKAIYSLFEKLVGYAHEF